MRGIEQLEGKVAVVTGAASGMGRAFADRFAAEDMKVVLADIEAEPLAQAVEEIVGRGGEAIGVPTDVSDLAAIEALAERTIAEFGAVHVLCNNAGVETGGRFEEIPVAAWRWVIDVNLYSVIYGCRTFLPLIREQGEGHIVNTGSVASFATEAPTMHPYAATKFAVLALSESLEHELFQGGERIGVSILAPGAVRTRMTKAERNRPADVPSTWENPSRAALLGMIEQITDERGMDPNDVAEMVVDAIRERRFFILTHPDEAFAAIDQRRSWMDSGERPPAPGTEAPA